MSLHIKVDDRERAVIEHIALYSASSEYRL